MMIAAVLTDHARMRMQQRGIPGRAVEALLACGRQLHDHRGARIVFFDASSRERLRRMKGGAEYKAIEPWLDSYAVIGLDGCVKTVGHRYRRLRRT
jgi:hypothetical protein